jgi:hypothetical protein
LLGDWFLPTAVVDAIPGFDGSVCPAHVTPADCFLHLTLTATTYQLTSPTSSTRADAVVNNTEIDFFNDDFTGCHHGVGSYEWTLNGGVLHLTLISDPCVSGPSVESRVAYLANQSFYRTH